MTGSHAKPAKPPRPQNTGGAGRDEAGRLLPGARLKPRRAPKTDIAFRLRARAAVDDLVIQKWIDEVECDGPEWVKASELLAGYGYGKPSQAVELSGPEEGTLRLDTSVLSKDELLAMVRLSQKSEPLTTTEEARFAEIVKKATPPGMVTLVAGAIEMAIPQIATSDE